MKAHSSFQHDFTRQFTPPGRSITLGPLRRSDGQRLINFARSLPPDDLLFLDRDITEQDAVDSWLDQSADSLLTILACEHDAVVGYATLERGSARWTRHVAELRVVVGPSARGIGLGRLLAELAFEFALADGGTKVIARMTPSQGAALSLFKRLGFEQEALLRDHAMSTNGKTHDLLVLAFHTRLHPEQVCQGCGAPVLNALVLDGKRLCSQCHETRYQELGGGA